MPGYPLWYPLRSSGVLITQNAWNSSMCVSNRVRHDGGKLWQAWECTTLHSLPFLPSFCSFALYCLKVELPNKALTLHLCLLFYFPGNWAKISSYLWEKREDSDLEKDGTAERLVNSTSWPRRLQCVCFVITHWTVHLSFLYSSTCFLKQFKTLWEKNL